MDRNAERRHTLSAAAAHPHGGGFLRSIGNAYFSRLLHLDPLALGRLLVIASDLHLARTQAVFEWVYGLQPARRTYQLAFESVADPRMPEDRRRLATMQDCHRWRFTEHQAYSAVRPAFGGSALGRGVLQSYRFKTSG